jgi:hypothetical protein
MKIENIKIAEKLLRDLDRLEYSKQKLDRLREFNRKTQNPIDSMRDDLIPMLGLARHNQWLDNHLELSDEELRELVDILYERRVDKINSKIQEIKEIIKIL